MITFGQQLKRIRKSAGYTQKDMAKILNMSERGYQKYELDTTKPPIDQINTICDLLGVNANVLLLQGVFKKAELLYDVYNIVLKSIEHFKFSYGAATFKINTSKLTFIQQLNAIDSLLQDIVVDNENNTIKLCWKVNPKES